MNEEKHIEFRKKILDFLMESPDTIRSYSEIKKMLGLDEWKANGYLDKALKTKKIEVCNIFPAVTKDGRQIGHMGMPVKMFKIR